MSPDEWKRQWAAQQQFLIKRHVFEAKTGDDVLASIKRILDSYDLTITRSNVNTRQTYEGFHMTLHRDYYQFNMMLYKRGIRNDSLWLKIYDGPSPQITAIWYLTSQGVDFNGGSLVFHDGEKIIPLTYKVILFDSNDLHSVHLQGKTITSRDAMIFTFQVS